MVVGEISGAASFDSAINVPGLVVVDFYATWCGPCVNIAPFVEQLSTQHPEVVFLKVNAPENNDIRERCNVNAFPTFQFYIKGNKVDEIKGANPNKLEQTVVSLKATAGGAHSSFSGTGHTLGGGQKSEVWDGVGCPPGMENARAARLKAFGHIDSKPRAKITADCDSNKSSSVPISKDDDEDEAIARAIALSMAPDGNNESNLQPEVCTGTVDSEQDQGQVDSEINDGMETEDWDGEEMVPVPVDETLLAQLISMEFSDVRARKGLVHGKTLDGALAWLEENQNDPDLDQPYMVKKKDAVPKKPLTAEEKAAKVQELKEKAARIKRERAEKEKADELQREKERRQRGQKSEEMEEERLRLARKREAARKKKEKDDIIKERQRLRAEIARDKELRKANNGVIPSVLGVDGYNPSAVQYDQKVEADTTPTSSSDSNKPSINSTSSVTPPSSDAAKSKSSTAASSSTYVPPTDPVAVIDSSIKTIARYRTGGDGGAALKLLLLLLRNVVNHPDERKYRSINLEGKAYKGKLAHLVGPSALLKAVGFRLNETEDKLVLPDGAGALVADTVEKLAKAEALYYQMNP